MPGHHDALAIQKPGKVVVPLNVFCHTVGDLQNTPELDFFLRGPDAPVQLGLSVGGEETEMFTICHRIGAPSVVYLHP